MTSIGMSIPSGREARKHCMRAALFAAALAVSAVLHLLLMA